MSGGNSSMSTTPSWAEFFAHWELVQRLKDRDRAFHLISMHADPMAVARTRAENIDQHYHEHRGPGTIRNHNPASVDWDEAKVEAVLEECEEQDG